MIAAAIIGPVSVLALAGAAAPAAAYASGTPAAHAGKVTAPDGYRGRLVSVTALRTLPDRAAVRAELAADGFGTGAARYGVRTSAAIPDVVYNGNKGAFLEVSYPIPSAARYDWSSLPVAAASRARAYWEEPIPAGETAGRIAVGVDQAAKANDDKKAFWAGALIALAGAAILTAATEVVHTRDWDLIRALRSR